MIFGKKKSLGNVFSEVQCCEKEKKKGNFLRQLSQLSRKSVDSFSSSLSSPRTPSPRNTFCLFPNPCELFLISALQGNQLTTDEMRNCANEIQNLNQNEQKKLLNFFTEGEASGIIENNALKAFSCSVLTSDCLKENIEIFEELWLNLNDLIIPNIQSMCFPLQTRHPFFDVKTVLLTIFRDRVIAKILNNIIEEIPEIRQILIAVNMETSEIPAELKMAIDICLGKVPVAKPRFLKKTRSKTDSCLTNKRKSVSWVDVNRKSSTFCA